MTLRAWIGGCLALSASLVAASASGQENGDGLGHALDRPLPTAPERPAPTEEEPAPTEEPVGPFVGPQIQLGYGYTKLADGFGGGDAHTAALHVFLQWPIHPLRTGLVAEIGSRDYSLGGDDLFTRGALEVGVQLPELIDPLVPHLSAILSVGVLVGERFETTVTHVFGGGGIELGAELRIFRNFHATASIAYQRMELAGAGFDLFMLHLGLGL
ncbi:MAG: hypothetical protein AB7S26_23735 [Sandaracinaceae bacterium]